MEYEQDWILRQIQIIVQVIARVVFHRQAVRYEIGDETKMSRSDLLYRKLQALLGEKKICEAEDLLFDSMDTDDKKYLELALDFYQRVNSFSDRELEAADFSRAEVQDGLDAVLKRFGYQDLLR